MKKTVGRNHPGIHPGCDRGFGRCPGRGGVRHESARAVPEQRALRAVLTRTPAEAQKTRTGDPNSPLRGKSAAKPPAPAASAAGLNSATPPSLWPPRSPGAAASAPKAAASKPEK